MTMNPLKSGGSKALLVTFTISSPILLALSSDSET
jgi:hypothetical protein